MGIYKSYKRRFHLKNAWLKKYQKNKQSNEDVPTNINEKAPNSIDEKDSFAINEETAVKAPNQSLQRMQQRNSTPRNSITIIWIWNCFGYF